MDGMTMRKPGEKKKTRELTEKEQEERFERMADEVESDEEPSSSEGVSKKPVPAKHGDDKL
jgi:hypothetical protein